MHLKIRKFTKNDKPKVIKLWRLVFKNDPPWNEPNAIIERKLAIQRNLFLVGEVNGKIIATVLGGYDGFRGWVYHLAILPSHQRKGIGKVLMLELEKKLKNLGCPKINLQVRSSNSEVIQFYKKIGYSQEDHVSMGKLLR
jgi:ribosomal protein S18 acetylase RimI-like enzyme